MITIRVQWRTDEDGTSVHITEMGHAGAGRKGNDLVCCAISTLLQTFACSCAKLEGAKTISKQKDGYMHIAVSGEYVLGEIVARYTMVMDGLDVLSAQYPECIEII